MKVSIAMATYNGAKALREQLDSFSCQTAKPNELVVCDDGSTDQTICILKEFAQRAPFTVRLEKNRVNLGYTKNFEKAATLCTGDLIFFSDQDDVWFPEKIEHMRDAFVTHPDMLLIIHDGKLVDEQLQWHGATKLGQVKAGWGSDESFITGALSVMHRDLRHFAFPIPEGVKGHDGWIHTLARFLDARLVVERPLQLIRRHDSNTSSWVASSVDKINRMSVICSHLKTVPAESYQDRIIFNEAFEERLRRILDDEVDSFRTHAIETAMRELTAEREALGDRSALLSAGFFAQKWMALKMLAEGKYRYFNGFHSFARDLARSPDGER